MTAVALALGENFQPALLNLTRTQSVRMAGVLEMSEGLEEIAVLGDAGCSSAFAGRSSIRAFRVRSGSEKLGLQSGDCLVVQSKDSPTVGDLVLIDVDGMVSACRVAGRRGTRLQFDPPVPKSPNGVEPKIIGAFAGILRKRLTAKHVEACSRSIVESSRSAGIIRLLRGKLGMVESTCAETSNPRLKRALRNEAANLRKQLQSESGIN